MCLHCEQTQGIEPQVAFDVDSFLGFASSIAVARQGLFYQPAPQVKQNITADNHLETDRFSTNGDGPERSVLTMIRNVPHFLLGTIVGAPNISMHILFPHLPTSREEFTSLTKEQHTRWLDQVFHPAVYAFCGAHYTQHIPSSYQHALANSTAHRIEGRQIETGSYRAQQALGYHLQPEYLHDIWQHILQKLAHTPGLADFREPQLFLSAKGTKLQFKTTPSQPTVLDALQNFELYFQQVLDNHFVQHDRFYVDIGKEICPNVSLSPSQHRQIDDEPLLLR